MLLAVLLAVLLGCKDGNSPLKPLEDGDACSPNAAGWQHTCIGDIEYHQGDSEIFSVVYQEHDAAYYGLKHACCEGAAIKATADAACQAGCYAEACATLFGKYDLDWDQQAYELCLLGVFFEACTTDEPPICADFRVHCDFSSNELFDTDGAVPLEDLDENEWCGAAAELAGETGSGGGEDSEAGGSDEPLGPNYHVSIEPNETVVIAAWTSGAWGAGRLSASGSGYADYRIGACPSDEAPSSSGQCVYLRRLVMYGGDIEVNGVEVSNLVAQLTEPVWVPLGSHFTIDVGDFPMLLTYAVGGVRVAWESSNSSLAEGSIDPLEDQFVLDALEFSIERDDSTVSTMLDLSGTHQ